MDTKQYKFCAALLAFIFAALPASARIGESVAEIQARYGAPISKSHEYSKEDLSDLRRMNPDHFLADGSELVFPGDKSLAEADSRLVFFDSTKMSWDDLRSSVIGRHPSTKDSDRLRSLYMTAGQHLSVNYYTINGIDVCVMYLDGRSVSEAYAKKSELLTPDVATSLINKSFPGSTLKSDASPTEAQMLTKIYDQASKVLVGCATYIDGKLTVSSTRYYDFLKNLEVNLQNDKKAAEATEVGGF